MDILKFFSFGNWSIFLKKDDISFFLAMCIIVFMTYVIKLIVLSIIDFGRSSGIISWFATFFVRIFQVILQLSALFVLVNIGNFNFLMVSLFVWLFYHVGVGIYYVADDYSGPYIFTLNKKISEYMNTSCKQYDVYLKNRKKFNNINKTIYVYRKNTIVG